jgi:hypothetical protein
MLKMVRKTGDAGFFECDWFELDRKAGLLSIGDRERGIFQTRVLDPGDRVYLLDFAGKTIDSATMGDDWPCGTATRARLEDGSILSVEKVVRDDGATLREIKVGDLAFRLTSQEATGLAALILDCPLETI